MVEWGLIDVFHLYMYPCVLIKVDSQASYWFTRTDLFLTNVIHNQILIKYDGQRYLSQFESEMFDSLQ